MRLLIFTLLSAALLNAQDAREIFRAAELGRKMSVAEAAQLEETVARRSKSVVDRLSLISFYTYSLEIDTDKAVAGRREHLLWLAQEEPESEVWESIPYELAVYPNGGRLRDPEGFAAIRDVWLAHLESKPESKLLIERIAGFLAIGDRERAIEFIERLNNPGYLGSYYASVLLGITARDYRSGTAVDSDGGVRQTDLWRKALAVLESSDNSAMVGSAATTLTRNGAALWANGFTEWDYSELAMLLTERIQRLEPNTLRWFSLNPELPNPGERRPMQLSIGGAVLAEKIINRVIPAVPLGLSNIRGTVSLDVGVSADGHVFKALPTGGPPQLFDICVAAVEQWTYKPTTLNGEPVIVFTKVELIF